MISPVIYTNALSTRSASVEVLCKYSYKCIATVVEAADGVHSLFIKIRSNPPVKWNFLWSTGATLAGSKTLDILTSVSRMSSPTSVICVTTGNNSAGLLG